jgi:hypothetical protein
MRQDEQYDDTWILATSIRALALRWGALVSCRRCGAVLVARQEAGEAVLAVTGHVCAGSPREERS